MYLRYSNKCHAAWAKFVLDRPAPAVSGGVYAYAVVNKYKNGVFQKSVTSNQGNGIIKTGQTSTYTGMVFDLTADFGYTADAEAVTFNNGYGKQDAIKKEWNTLKLLKAKRMFLSIIARFN